MWACRLSISINRSIYWQIGGDKLLIEPDVCISELISTEHLERILIMYPYEFRNKQILKDNITKMSNVIREYINELELYRRCIDAIPNLIWDSQKISLQNEADEHQRKADELAEVMNDGISPYHWCVCKNFDQYINGMHYKANYVIYLEKI